MRLKSYFELCCNCRAKFELALRASLLETLDTIHRAAGDIVRIFDVGKDQEISIRLMVF